MSFIHCLNELICFLEVCTVTTVHFSHQLRMHHSTYYATYAVSQVCFISIAIYLTEGAFTLHFCMQYALLPFNSMNAFICPPPSNIM